jgi:transposase, IS30 family
MAGYRRINNKDREDIMVYLNNGDNQECIASKIGVSQSAISREINKGTDRGMYNPLLAQRKTDKRAQSRISDLKINLPTWAVIENHLAIHWSPYQIADFLHQFGEGSKIVSVSEKTIYNYLHFHMKGELQKLALLELRQKGKRRRKKGEENRGKLVNMTLIDGRPEEINNRSVPGHWEGDLIIGKDHKSALSVIVERQTRYVLIDRLESYSARDVRQSIEKRLKKIEPKLVKSITYDQGKEMAEHESLASNIKMKVYFCHPHSPWEKGTCENTNFLIRDMLEEETDFRNISQAQVSRIARLLNERPRKTLGMKTPKEKFKQLCAESY